MRSRHPRLIIGNTNLPMRMPLQFTLVIWLILDHLHAPHWLWGFMSALTGFVWIVWFIDVFTRQNVPLESFFNHRK